MIDGNIKITVNTPLYDFGNYRYSEIINESELEQKHSSKFSFQETTCIENKLIVLAEQN